MRKLVGVIAVPAALAAMPAQAERAETLNPAVAFVAPKCPVSSERATAAERDADVTESIFAPLLASIAGDLVGSGIKLLGAAIDAASQERGIVAEASTAYYANHIGAVKVADSNAGKGSAKLSYNRLCLVLALPSQSGSIDQLTTNPDLVALNSRSGPLAILGNDRTASLKLLTDHGVSTMPAVYVEAELLPRKGAMVVRPVLVWYREKMKGAPSRAAAAELHATFATPAHGDNAVDIGAPFAIARIILPRIVPGPPLGPQQLSGHSSVMVPLRPSAGAVDSEVGRFNGLYTAIATRRAELKQAERALEAAERMRATKPNPENEEAVVLARIAKEDAQAALQDAQTAAGPALKGADLGATNVKFRFVVIREADKFGQMIAKVLNGKADKVGEAVTTLLTPSPAWAESDTKYLEAMNNVSIKQREYDEAIGGGDMKAARKAADELLILKARANEAAVASHKSLPYPGLTV